VAVLGQHRRQAAVDLGECLVPGRGLEAPVAPDQRRRDPVGVIVEGRDARALRADEAGAQDVVGVAANLRDAVVLDRQLEAAGRFTERAGGVLDRRGDGAANSVTPGSARL
jgi:hypothetical protein